MNINIILTAKPGYRHSAALLEPARYVAYKLRESGHQVSVHVNRFADTALNVVFGAHEFYEPEWFSKGDIAIFNLEQLARSSRDSHRLDPSYLDLLKKYPVIDYDLANVRLYRDHGSALSSLSAPIFEFGYAPYLDFRRTASIKDRPIDILFFGSLNEKRIKILQRIEDCGVRIQYITPDAPLYGDELNHLIRNSKAVLNIPFYNNRVFEQVRVAHALSCGTPVISTRSDRIPAKYIASVTWFDEGYEAEFFFKQFETTEWYAAAEFQLQAWRQSDSKMNFNDWKKMNDHFVEMSVV